MSVHVDETEVFPGECSESALITEDTLENYVNMSSTLEEIKKATISTAVPADLRKSQILENLEELTSSSEHTVDDDDIRQNPEWLNKKTHIFVLSSAGKPIYSRYGNEDKLATMFATMQALVSVVQDGGDSLEYIIAGDTTFVFLIKAHVVLVAVSKETDSKNHLTMQLNYVYNQIASMLTLTKLNTIFEQRHNYDLRRLLSGVDRLIDHYLRFTESQPSFLLGSVQCLPLSPSMRDSTTAAITSSCSKIKNLVFAVLLAESQLVTLVRMRKYHLHPGDLHLIVNLVGASQSFRAVESWTPLCLPRFDGSGFLYGHVSYLAEDCQACLLLLTVERDVFAVLSGAKQKIVEKMRRNGCLSAINESLATARETCTQSGFPELRHYLYKCKSTSQFHQPAIGPPYLVHHSMESLYSPNNASNNKDSQSNLTSNNSAGHVNNLTNNTKHNSNNESSGNSNQQYPSNSNQDPSNSNQYPSSSDNSPSNSDSTENFDSFSTVLRPSNTSECHPRLLALYRRAYDTLHTPGRQLKLTCERGEREVVLSWDTRGFELYAVLEPLTSTETAISVVGKLLNWIKKKEGLLFQLSAPTF